jgi:hypothetical protein
MPFRPNFPQLHIGEPSSGFTSGPKGVSQEVGKAMSLGGVLFVGDFNARISTLTSLIVVN